MNKNEIKILMPLFKKLKNKNMLVNAIMQDKISEKLARCLIIHDDLVDEILQKATDNGEILYK